MDTIIAVSPTISGRTRNVAFEHFFTVEATTEVI